MPENVLTFQKHAGCATSPGCAHEDAGSHGEGPLEPPTQKKPIGQMTGVSLVEPASQKYPALTDVVHAAQTVTDPAPVSALHVPTGHGAGYDERASQNDPGGHRTQTPGDEAPVTLLHVPLGQDSQASADGAPGDDRHEPAGHGEGAAAPARQKAPVAQLRHAALEKAPVALLNVPAGHGVALKEDHGQ